MDASPWTQHEATIRRLYVTERKSLKEVKGIMEGEHGFPETKLSTWESTLRDTLGVFKRLKKEHWPILYEEYERRGKRPFNLYAGGHLVYTWQKIWKELRRRRKLEIRQDIVLPQELIVRTPSPFDHVHRPRDNVETIAITTAAVSTGSNQAESSGSLSLRTSSETAYTLGSFNGHIRVMTEEMPWNVSRRGFLAQIIGADEVYGKYEDDGPISYALMPQDGFFEHAAGRFVDGRPLARIADTRFPDHFANELSTGSFSELSPYFYPYHNLNVLVYLASNDLIPEEEEDSYLPRWTDLLDLLVNRVSRRTVAAIFSRDYLSIRATWEKAFYEANRLQDRDAIVLLIEIALEHHFDWIHPIMNTTVLLATVKVGNSSLLQELLKRGACTFEMGFAADRAGYATPLVGAAMTRTWDCANLLLKEIDINEELWYNGRSQGLISHLQILLQHVEAQLSLSWVVDPDDGLYCFLSDKQAETLASCTPAVCLFLQAGADVDRPYTMSPEPPNRRLGMLHEELATPLEWLPTCLDMSLYWDEHLFNYLHTHSRNYSSQARATRAGIIKTLLNGGNKALDQYFRVKPRPAQGVLEMLLVEQFFVGLPERFLSDWKVNVRLARLFIEYGVGINSNATRRSGGVDSHLRRIMAHAMKFGYCEDVGYIVTRLIRNGAAISEDVMELAVQRIGVSNLEALATFGVDIQRNGRFALLRAARVDNYEAVEWLLQRGVSVFSEFIGMHGNLTLVGALVDGRVLGRTPEQRRYVPCVGFNGARTDIAMIQFLLSCGAYLKLHTLDSSPLSLLSRPGWRSCDVSKLVLEYPTELAKLSESEWRMLCAMQAGAFLENGQMFEQIRTQCRGFDTGSVLAAAIVMTTEDLPFPMEGGITQLLEDSSNIDLYSVRGENGKMTPLQAAALICNEYLVQTLLSRGADVNAPADEIMGRTAIAAICSYEPCSTQEARKRISLIQLLLANRADLYALSMHVGFNPEPVLNILARKGDLEAASILLEHGVDLNYVWWSLWNGEISGLSALDEAASNGRLDMIHLLLKSGGLSAEPGDTGYLGTTKVARSAAIIELIQRHQRQMETEFAERPELYRKHQATIDQQARHRAEVIHVCKNHHSGGVLEVARCRESGHLIVKVAI